MADPPPALGPTHELVLTGRFVELVPLSIDHADELFAVTPPDTFAYFLSWPASWTRDAFAAWLARELSTPRRRAFAVRSRADGRLLGSTSLYDVDPPHRQAEIGSTWYAQRARGTAVNPECKLLLMTLAFEREGVHRVQLKCDARNQASQRAIAKLGAVREGVLRRHRVVADGFVRDTVYFSVIPSEWPDMRRGLEARVAAGSGPTPG